VRDALTPPEQQRERLQALADPSEPEQIDALSRLHGDSGRPASRDRCGFSPRVGDINMTARATAYIDSTDNTTDPLEVTQRSPLRSCP